MFRFTIRDVLWLTTLIAVVLGGMLAYGRLHSLLVLQNRIIEEQEEKILKYEAQEQIRTALQKASPNAN
jgi:hypothetical protein